MNILYLHGYNSVNINSRTEWLSTKGNLTNPLMDYHNYVESYQYLDKIVVKNKIDIIVGSSLGGLLGFYLANYHNLKTVLLNPALIMGNVLRPDNRQLATQAKHFISLGKHDDVIPPHTTKAVLKEVKSNYFIKEYNIGHKTTFDVFLDICKISGL